MSTKIDIISGFLGAGKTTWIKKLLSEVYQKEQVVLIENEFGEIGIDGGFLQEAGIEIREMNSGCICCSLVGDFGAALKEVLEQYHPDRIIIEPSGVGKLSDVMAAVSKLTSEADVLLNSYATVVDAGKCRMYTKNFGEFYNNQIQYAGTIILSRTAQISEEKLKQCVELLRKQNEKAAIITTDWKELGWEQILAAMEPTVSWEEELLEEARKYEEHHHHQEECEHGHHHHQEECEHEAHEHHHEHGEDCTCGCHEHHHHHDADEVFESYGVETPNKYSKEELEHILQELSKETYGKILRAKGMVPSDNSEWYYFDMVPEEYEVRTGVANYTGRICVIGAEMKKDLIQELFRL